ncbi:MAG TPA: GspH/FimT family pseudopilin, partial [Pseudomonadales bacterium]|nr:GspH/FimT family pseudopilin [Pseudomonadales bacterium]
MHTHPAHVTQSVNRRSVARVQQGFTLIELMITMAIMAILLSLAIPSFNNTIRDNRVLTAGNALVAAVAQTRSEAVKRGKLVSMCPSVDGLA